MVGTVLSTHEAMLVFQRWSVSAAPITCSFHGAGLEIQLLGEIQYVGPGLVRMRTATDDAFVRVPVESVHAYRYCEPGEMQTDGETRYGGFLLVLLLDGTFLRFGEIILEGQEVSRREMN